ncbi:MAG: NAD(P)/FAD-dependent oxidoreductase [Clostridia bacterium]
MIIIKDIKLPVGYSQAELNDAIFAKLGNRQASAVTVIKKSIDARKKPNIYYILSVAVCVQDEFECLRENINLSKYSPPISLLKNLNIPNKKTDEKIIVIGSGPAGLFCALTLVEAGLKPLIIERGSDIEKRVEEVENFNNTGRLNVNSNIQFGEGGAGAFSDGKLTTGTSNPLNAVVIGEFVHYGAPAEIACNAKPHIGTDYLRVLIKNMRARIIEGGGEFWFDTCVKDFKFSNERISELVLSGKNEGVISCNRAVLAIGHSSRDTFETLLSRGAIIEQKPFSIGVRIEHLQKNINIAQYGQANLCLPSADYKLSCHLDNGRSVYTFCMCPAGEVVCAASEENGIVTNGMSFFARKDTNANSALLVNVTPNDFASDNKLAGMYFQQKYERLAYKISNSYRAPLQKVGDFCQNKVSSSFGNVKPSIKSGTVFADLRACLPSFAIESLKEGLKVFDRKLNGFSSADNLLIGVETRSSSPIRILRDNSFQSNLKGIYPCGEGSGYSGGITSSAVDGILVALSIINDL